MSQDFSGSGSGSGSAALSANDAIHRLVDGNRRFVAGLRSIDNFRSQLRLPELARLGQSPFAIILCCSDSRAPAEILFDQGLGDLFVIRVAGNVVAPSLVGSVEFAAATFGVELVVVMGHTGCGAVLATIDAMKSGESSASENIQDIISRIRPSIEPLTHLKMDQETLRREATRANILASANHLRHGSRIIEKLVSQGKMLVVGAECDIKTGIVEFFDGVPPDFGSRNDEKTAADTASSKDPSGQNASTTMARLTDLAPLHSKIEAVDVIKNLNHTFLSVSNPLDLPN
jgi:carbonic anhydrase